MENAKYIILYIVIVLAIWGIGTMFAKSVSDYEVITPEDNVKCVVVSRMFNTGVDCWKEL